MQLGWRISAGIFCSLVRKKFSAKFLRFSETLLKVILLSITLGFPTKSAIADTETTNREFQLKTAYLFHIAELTEWPSSASFTICQLGDSPIKSYLPALNGQLINGERVQINLEQQSDPGSCRIIFISNVGDLNPALSEQAKLRHILLVSDVEGFASRGGMLQLALRENKIRIIINLQAIKQAGLKLSSKLLRMAEILE